MITSTIQQLILKAEQEGTVQRTFRRLDPPRQEAIIHAILAETAEVGPENIRIQEIATKGGVSIGSMYQYFPDREHLQLFAVMLSTQNWVDMFDLYLPQMAEMPLRDGLRAYLMGGIEMGEMGLGEIQFFGRTAYQNLNGKYADVVSSLSAKMLEAIKEMLRKAQERHEIRLDIDLEVNARLIHTMMIALGDSQLFPYLNQYYRLTDESRSFDQIVDQAIDLIFTGLGTGEGRRE